MKKRMLSLLLALVMVLSVMTVAAMAKGVQTFADVNESDWFYDAVCYVTDNGLMNGTGRGFAPQQTTSRAMLWAVLSRVDGQNAKRNANDWYAAAQLWAIQHDISDGTAPEAPITREQLAAMLYRYAQRKGLVRAAAYADLSGFADAASVSAYAEEALQWAVANGILTGMDGKLCPQGNATRAQVAQILYRLCETWDLLPADNTAAIASAIYLADDPEHTHVWTYTSKQNGTHSATCTCGETKETERCTLAEQADGSWKCADCGFIVAKENAVSTWDELNEAINGTEKKSEIYLVADIALKAPLDIKQNTTIYGCNRTLTFAEDYEPSNLRRMIRNRQENTTLTLQDIIFDGKDATTTVPATVIDTMNSALSISGCEFKNFTAPKIISAGASDSQRPLAVVTISNTSFHNNSCIGVAETGNYDGDFKRASLLYFFSADIALDGVSLTDNTISKGTNSSSNGNGNLIYIKNGNSKFIAKEIIAEGNSRCTLFSTYSVNYTQEFRFESGSVKGEGSMWVCANMYIGKAMRIECGEISGWNSYTDHALVYENDGELICGLAKYGNGQDTIYTGSGTHTGTKTNIQDLTVTP